MNCHSRIILVICDSYFVSFALKAFNRGPDYLPQPEGEHVHDAMTNGTPSAWLVAYLILVGRIIVARAPRHWGVSSLVSHRLANPVDDPSCQNFGIFGSWDHFRDHLKWGMTACGISWA